MVVRYFKSHLKFIIKRLCLWANNGQWTGRQIYTQTGEDVIVKYLFESKGVVKPSYLDIGTNNPSYNNNTYLFYVQGSRGVCVEADGTLIERIKTVRPEDKVINVGVSVSTETEADFYIFNESGLNTFDKQEAMLRQTSGSYKIEKVVKVPLGRINNLIESNYPEFPDFLSLDIEGLDLDVLKSINWSKYPIPVICVETCTYSENHIKPKNKSITDFMNSIGYEIYADTYINTIYVNANWFFNYHT